MRQSSIVTVLVVGLLGAVAFLIGPQLFGGGDTSIGHWDTEDEIVVPPPAADIDPAAADLAADSSEREQLAFADEADFGPGERTNLTLRGRVVDRFHGPVADAKVWLDFGRGGPRGRGNQQRRVPDPVLTDADGRFAFQGQTFRNLRINLLVLSTTHAPAQFDRNLGEVETEKDLGELVVLAGGQMIGRVTDLGGASVAGAEVHLQPERDNSMRTLRDRDAALPELATDNNGYYRFDHVAAGDWRVAATAQHHQNGNSDIVAVEDELRAEVADIRLGPGFEVTGIVSDDRGAPLADAEVTARPRRTQPADRGDRADRGGRGGRGNPFAGFGSDQRAVTDAQGRFLIEHLPGTMLDLTVRKDGYLTVNQADIDSTALQPIYMTMYDGLRIAGLVTDAATGAPVTRFHATAQWVRNLPTGLDDNPDWMAAMQVLRDGNLDDNARRELRSRLEDMRSRVRGQGGGGPPNRRRGGRERDKPTDHPGGRFVESGLQEGVYVVVVESDDHSTFRSDEIELRAMVPAPEVLVPLVRGYTVSGVVHDADGRPIANAQVELQMGEGGEPNAGSGWQSGPGTPGLGSSGLGRPGGGRNRRGGIGQFINALGGPVAHATTDRSGRFAIEHAPAGNYRVTASAKGHDEAKTEPFALGSDLAGVDLALGALGSLTGRVLGATAEQLGDVRVVAVPVGDGADVGAMFRGGRPFVTVLPDGGYAFPEIAPGSYAVRAVVGNAMRELFAQFAAGEMLPDVTVRPGDAVTFDVTLALPQSGSVTGSVLHNGAPAVGFQVALRNTSEADGGGQRGGRNFAFGFGRGQNGEVDAQGRFHMRDVPAGTYELTVSADRRSGALYTQIVVVVAQGTADLSISVATAAIEGAVTVADGTPATELTGSVQLLPGVTELPADFGDMRRGGGGGGRGGGFRARVQAGRFAFEQVPPGNYLAVLTVRGRERTTMPVTANLGQRTPISIAAGPVATPSTAPASAGGPAGDPAAVPIPRPRRGQ